MGESERKCLVVSLHDVAPPFEAEIRAQLEALTEIGVTRFVLKVVPNWHGEHPLPATPSLVHLLQEQQRTGSEVVWHGIEHRRQGPLRGPLPLRTRGALFAGDAAEFLTLTPQEAACALREGQVLFAQAQLPVPTAFCAPGWLLAPDLKDSLQAGGIRHLIGMFTVRELATARRLVLPATGYLGVAGWHELGMQWGNGLVQLVLHGVGMRKVYLHPQGGTQSPVFRSVLERIAHSIGQGWSPTTYGELMNSTTPRQG